MRLLKQAGYTIMYKRLSAEQKITLIKRILNGENISTVAKEQQLSRTVLYQWLKKYKNAAPRAKQSVLSVKKMPGRQSWGVLSSALRRRIRNEAIKHPEYSCAKIAQLVGKSEAGVWKVLKRYGLNTPAKRDAFVRKNGNKIFANTTYQQRQKLVQRFKAGEKVSALCREYHISRTTFYNWLERYEDASRSFTALQDKRQRGESHYRYVHGAGDLLLTIIIEQPTLPMSKLTKLLNEKAGKYMLSYAGVYKTLRHLQLSTVSQRLVYAQGHAPVVSLPSIPESWTLPQTPRYSFISFLPPPVQKIITSYGPLFITSYFLGLLCIIFFNTIVFAGGMLHSIGIFFSWLALAFGTFFFIYSMKYYLTIAIVLSSSRKDSEENGRNLGSFLAKIFGVEVTIEGDKEQAHKLPSNKGLGLQHDLSHIHLERHPFVSIHLSTYNEKRVINRLLTAATSMDYPNFEVVLADDSNDETVEIIKQWENHPRVKVSRRASREGYKGAALQVALGRTDKRAEFIMVFDADFIPYPDSITQFLKYFQLVYGDLKPETIRKHNEAAVQGYQWHVLNKSENWITRGIRSEYSGSYVIERSGAEAYGGLKQISGSVYMIRRDILEKIGWGTSITEDFELTLRLYAAGYKVIYTPYIQAPAEAVSTLKRMIRQRMRWAEGHSFNVKKMYRALLFGSWRDVIARSEATKQSPAGYEIASPPEADRNDKRWIPSPLTFAEKLEFLYLVPYYLQAAFFMGGTIAWLVAETIFRVRLPFWTEVWGWSLVLTNLFALPLMNMVGLFMEESEEKDYVGLFAFIALSYLVAPFQAYAAIKGFIEEKEGPWFRTPKTGRITDVFVPGKFGRFFAGLFGLGSNPALSVSARNEIASLPLVVRNDSPYLALATANNTFATQTVRIPTRVARRIGRGVLGVMLLFSVLLQTITPYIQSMPKVQGAASGSIVTPKGQVRTGGQRTEDGRRIAEDRRQKGENTLLSSLTRQLDNPSTMLRVNQTTRQLFSIPQAYAAEKTEEVMTENQVMRIVGEKTAFQGAEQPEFSLKEKIGLFGKVSGFLGKIVGRKQQAFKEKVKIEVKNGKGEKVMNFITQQVNNESVRITPAAGKVRPGKYTITAVFQGKTITQEFSWGVLSINTNKSIYTVSETAKLSIAVLDDKGEMACNAKVELKIRNPKHEIRNLTTINGEIKVNPECSKKEYTEKPDYETDYTVGGEGTYEMELTAVTGNGTRTITDSFKVQKSVDFDIERTGPTRIYPPATYQMSLRVKANKDFTGIVEERVPVDFQVRQPKTLSNNSSEKTVAFKQSMTNQVSLLTWDVALKKGEEKTLTYEFKTPNLSPYYYTLGPATLFRNTKSVTASPQVEYIATKTLTGQRVGPYATNLPGVYEMRLLVAPKQTYKGFVVEQMPENFDIIDAGSSEVKATGKPGQYAVTKGLSALNEHSDIDAANTISVLSDNRVKSIYWKGEWEKGKQYSVTYQIDTRGLKPEYITKYLNITQASRLGEAIQDYPNSLTPPNSLIEYETGTVAFREGRYWQLAIDANTSAKLPGTGAEADHATGTIVWNTETNIQGDDDAWATSTLDDNQISEWLQATNFGFTASDIPALSRIDGIVVSINRKAATNSRIQDYDVQLIKGGTAQGNDNANAGVWWPTTAAGEAQAYPTSGATNDLWGLSWNQSDIVGASNFGVALSATKATATNAGVVASVDYISITVYYTQPTISGTIYQSDESTPDTTAYTVNVSVNNGAPVAATVASGVYYSYATHANTNPIAVYISNHTNNATAYTTSTGAAVTGLDLIIGNVTVGAAGTSTTNANICAQSTYPPASTPDDKLLSCDGSNNITFESGSEVHVLTGKTYAPGANAITQGTGGDLHIDDSGTFTGGTAQDHTIAGNVTIDAGATLTAPSTSNNGTLRIGGNFTNSATGTFTPGSGKILFNASAASTYTVDLAGDSFFDVEFISVSSPTWNLSSALDVDGDLTITTGTLVMNGSNNITTAGAVSFAGGAHYTKGTGTWTFDGTGVHIITDSTGGGKQNLGTVIINATSGNRTLSVSSVIVMDSLTVASGDVFTNYGNYPLSIGSTATAGSGDITVDGTMNISGTTLTILSSSGGIASLSGLGTLSVNNLILGDGSTSITVDNETTDLAIEVAGNFTVKAQTTYQASSSDALTIAGSFVNEANATFTPNSGTVTMDATTGSPTITSNGDAFNNLYIDNNGTVLTWTLEDALDVNKDLLIDANNTLDAKTGENNNVNVAGNFTNNGVYQARSNITTFDGGAGSTQVITGATTFNHLSATTSGNRTLQFGESTEFTIAGNLTLTGTSCNAMLILRSTTPGSQYTLTKNAGGSTSISYLDVKDSIATNALSPTNSANSGNNTNWTIAASPCKGTSTSSAATGYSFQRKTFYDSHNARYWMFAYDGTEIVIKFSSDGTNWTGINGLNYNTNDFSVWNATISSTGYVWLAVKNSDDIKVLRGTLSVSDISWDDDIDVALDGTGAADTYSYPYISADSSNYLWVGARHLSGSNYAYKAVKSENAGDTDFGTLTWGTAAKLSADKMDENIYGNIVPLSSGDMYAAFVSGTELQGCRWDADNSPSAQWEDSSGSLCIANTGYSNAVIDTSTVNTATKQAPQGKTFLDSVNSRYWSFYYNGSAIEYSYSQNGSSWTSSATQSYNTADFSVFYKNISGTGYVFLVTKCNDYDICLKRGQLGSSSITNWTSEITVYDGTGTADTYSKPVVSVSADNYVFVAARKEVTTSDGNKFFKAIVNKSVNTATNDLSSWGTAAGFEIPSGNSGDIALLSQTGANMVLISGNNSNHISAWKYNGTSWVNTGSVYDFFNFENTSFNGVVYAITISGGYVYFGGNFTLAGGLAANYIVRYNITSAVYEALGNASTKGVNALVYALVVDASNNYLYVGGNFTSAYASPSNLAVSYVTRISTTSASNTFETLGNGTSKGVSGTVNALALDTVNNYLYIGGGFTMARASPSDLTVYNITRISTTSASNTFEALGNGATNGVTGGVVNALALDTANNYLYIGGGFTTAYASPLDITANRIVRISTTSASNTFEALGNGATKGLNNAVDALVLDSTNNYLYIGGYFSQAYASPSDLTVNNIARISTTSAGNTFEAMGNGGTKGVNSYIHELVLDSTNNYLYIVGEFVTAYASPSNLTVNYITRISTTGAGNTFEALGNGGTKGVSGGLFALDLDRTNNYLYFGGGFTTAYASPSNLTASNVSRISTTGADTTFELLTSGVKGVNNVVRAIVLDSINNYLYIGGDFTTAYASPTNLTVNRVARINMNSASSTFEALGNSSTKGVVGAVNALALDTTNNYLYIGGAFTTANASPSNLTVNYITRISTTSAGNTFEAMGNGTSKGVNGVVSALALDITNNYLYLGGNFVTAYAAPDLVVNYITRISTTSASNTFEALGNSTTFGVNGGVYALALDTTNNYLYLGGVFTSANASPLNLTVNRIARISTTSAGSTFEALGNGGNKGVNNYVYALALDTTNNYLYLGGDFTQAYASPSDLTVNYIARISTTSAGNTFEALGNGGTKGVSGGVRALAVDSTNNYLYIGGTFATAYASPSDLTVNNIARISTTSAGNTFETLGNGITKGADNTVRAFFMDNTNRSLYLGGSYISTVGRAANYLSIYAKSVTVYVGISAKISAAADSSGNIHLLYTKSEDNDLYYKKFDASGGTWGSEVSVYTGTVSTASLLLDSDNNDVYAIFIDSNTVYFKKAVSPHASGDWDNSATTITSTGTNNYLSGCQPTSTTCFQLTSGTSNPYDVEFYYYEDIMVADAIDTVVSGLENTLSAVADGSDNVHLLYVDADPDDTPPDSTDQVSYKKWNGTSWSSATLVANAADDNDAYPSLSLDTSDSTLYALWIDSSTSHILYSSCSVSSSCDDPAEWAAETDWKTTGTNTYITSNYSGNGVVFAEWTTGSAGSYTVNWDSIIAVPENILLLLVVAPLLPKIGKRKWYSRRGVGKLLKYLLDKIRNSKVKI